MKRLIVINPVAGHLELQKLHAALAHYFGNECQIYQTTANDGETRAVVRRAIAEGYTQVIACGGDGTISVVADALAQTAVSLGIVPVGTGNLLARELEIPLDLDKACQVIVQAQSVRFVDGMRVNGRVYNSHISMGVYSQLIEHTTPEIKQKLGRSAYVLAALKEIKTYPTWKFHLTIDGKTEVVEASMIIAANVGAVGIPPLRWGPNIVPDNGYLTLCVVKSASATDYFDLIWKIMLGEFDENDQVDYLTVTESVVVAVDDPEIAVRADGEVIGNGRVDIQLVPSALKVIVPKHNNTQNG